MSEQRLGAAADDALRGLLAGPGRPARVVVATRAAVYAQLDRLAGAGLPDVVALLAQDAVRVPGSLVVASAQGVPVARATVGDRVVIGAGRWQGGGMLVTPTRWWSSRLTPVPARSSGVAGASPPAPALPVRELPPEVAEPAGRLAAALRDGDPCGPAARALVGLGPGLTPAGDDVLAGALVGLLAAGRPALRARLADAVLPLTGRTTAVSAALLHWAALGHAAPPVAVFATALAGPGWRSSGSGGPMAVPADLLAVGSTSGAALAAGVLAGFGRLAPSALLEVS